MIHPHSQCFLSSPLFTDFRYCLFQKVSWSPTWERIRLGFLSVGRETNSKLVKRSWPTHLGQVGRLDVNHNLNICHCHVTLRAGLQSCAESSRQSWHFSSHIYHVHMHIANWQAYPSTAVVRHYNLSLMRDHSITFNNHDHRCYIIFGSFGGRPWRIYLET